MRINIACSRCTSLQGHSSAQFECFQRSQAAIKASTSEAMLDADSSSSFSAVEETEDDQFGYHSCPSSDSPIPKRADCHLYSTEQTFHSEMPPSLPLKMHLAL